MNTTTTATFTILAPIYSIFIAGAGQMGTGIAIVCLKSGYNVTLFDLDQTALDRAHKKIEKDVPEYLQKFICTKESEASIDTNLVIEAIAENREIKSAFWKNLETSPQTLLSSNTSSYSITELSTLTHYPHNFIGIHFMNPAQKMPVVEIISGLCTSKKSEAHALEFVKSLEKTPICVQDRPGFVVNRILLPMINEAMFLYESGVASMKDIDAAMKGAAGHPMGPFTLADFIGLDTCLAILKDLHARLGEDKYRPCPLLPNYVNAGWLGKKSGRGFYEYA
jgi:3-hydroxybutyryl-CoA dehydrogenase